MGEKRGRRRFTREFKLEAVRQVVGEGRTQKAVAEELRTGRVQIVVGTHALLSSAPEFADLGLVVIDEQPRLGVAQRARLWNKADVLPHVLVMTATPIPRTLAMTAFGDLDVSIIKHAPPGRGQVVTRQVDPAHRSAAYEFIRERLKAGKSEQLDLDVVPGLVRH